MVTIRCQDREFSHIRGIVFDKDGTLEDSADFWREKAIERARSIEVQVSGLESALLSAFGIHDDILDPMGLMAVGSRTENEIAAAAYIAATGYDWFTSLAIARKAFREADQTVPDRINPLFTGCTAVIRDLSQAGLKLAILSSDTTARVEEFVKKNDLLNYISVRLGSDRGLCKPDPALFIQTCQALETDPATTLMIGDSSGDMEMALKAGAAGTIGINWQKTSVNPLPFADVMISRLDAIVVFANFANL